MALSTLSNQTGQCILGTIGDLTSDPQLIWTFKLWFFARVAFKLVWMNFLRLNHIKPGCVRELWTHARCRECFQVKMNFIRMIHYFLCSLMIGSWSWVTSMADSEHELMLAHKATTWENTTDLFVFESIIVLECIIWISVEIRRMQAQNILASKKTFWFVHQGGRNGGCVGPKSVKSVEVQPAAKWHLHGHKF